MSRNRRVRAVRVVVCLLAALAVTGCAAQAPAAARSAQPQPGVRGGRLQPAPVGPPAPTPTPARAAMLEQVDKALAAARLQLAAMPSAAHHRQVGEEYLRLGVLDLAYDHFMAALRLTRTDAASHDGLARVWRDWGFPGRGLSAAHRAVYFAPTSATARNTLGTLLLKLGQPAAAQSAFETAHDLDPAAGYIINNLCYAALAQGRSAEAVERCGEALRATPDLTAARNNLGLAYAASGDFDRARAEFSRTGLPATAAYNLGIAYLSSDRLDDAARAFWEAWQADPTQALAADRLQQVNALRGSR